jgi:hypothetical protein
MTRYMAVVELWVPVEAEGKHNAERLAQDYALDTVAACVEVHLGDRVPTEAIDQKGPVVNDRD